MKSSSILACLCVIHTV